MSASYSTCKGLSYRQLCKQACKPAVSSVLQDASRQICVRAHRRLTSDLRASSSFMQSQLRHEALDQPSVLGSAINLNHYDQFEH